MNRLVAVVSALAVSSGACRSPLSSGELLDLERAEARWEARGFQDYSFELRRACFCPEPMTLWTRVEVVAGQVVRVVVLETGAEVPPSQRAWFPTVEGVFGTIRTVAKADWVQEVQVEFDPELGFPTLADFVSKPNIQDASGTYYLRHAVPLP